MERRDFIAACIFPVKPSGKVFRPAPPEAAPLQPRRSERNLADDQPRSSPRSPPRSPWRRVVARRQGAERLAGAVRAAMLVA